MVAVLRVLLRTVRTLFEQLFLGLWQVNTIEGYTYRTHILVNSLVVCATK